MWPPVFHHSDFNTEEEKWDAMDAFLSRLLQQNKDLAIYARRDLEEGTATHRLFSSAPAAADLEDGEMVVYESGATRRVYTKVDGTVRYVDLT